LEESGWRCGVGCLVLQGLTMRIDAYYADALKGYKKELSTLLTLPFSDRDKELHILRAKVLIAKQGIQEGLDLLKIKPELREEGLREELCKIRAVYRDFSNQCKAYHDDIKAAQVKMSQTYRIWSLEAGHRMTHFIQNHFRSFIVPAAVLFSVYLFI
jgi:hypothetical protein